MFIFGIDETIEIKYEQLLVFASQRRTVRFIEIDLSNSQLRTMMQTFIHLSTFIPIIAFIIFPIRSKFFAIKKI